MDNKQVACPYCGHQINNNDEKCSNCGEFFVEPNLSDFKLVSIPLYITSEAILTAFGFPLLYSLIWALINRKNIGNISNQKDLKKFKVLLLCFCTFVLLAAFFKFLVIVALIFEIFLAYRILRIIEKYTYIKYNSGITHHHEGMIFFRTLYVIYFVDTYLIRVKDPQLRYCMNVDKWFEYLIILTILIIILYALGMLNIPLLIF